MADMAEIISVSAGLLLPSSINATVKVQEEASPTAAVVPAPQSSEDYLFVETRHPNTVLQGLNSLRLNNAFCDVTLCCGGQEFPCHRIVLASFSSYFQVNALFLTGMSVLKRTPPLESCVFLLHPSLSLGDVFR